MAAVSAVQTVSSTMKPSRYNIEWTISRWQFRVEKCSLSLKHVQSSVKITFKTSNCWPLILGIPIFFSDSERAHNRLPII